MFSLCFGRSRKVFCCWVIAGSLIFQCILLCCLTKERESCFYDFAAKRGAVSVGYSDEDESEFINSL